MIETKINANQLQSGGGDSVIKDYEALSYTVNTTLFTSPLPIPNLDVLTEAGTYRVHFDMDIEGTTTTVTYIADVSPIKVSDMLLGYMQNLYIGPGAGDSVSIFRSGILDGSSITWSDWSGNSIAEKQNKTLSSAITVGGVSQTTVEGALGAINTNTDGALKNTATGANSLAILGTVTSNNTHSIAIGPNATAQSSSGIIIGNGYAGDYSTVAIGTYTFATKRQAIAIGGQSMGARAQAVAAIQLGEGTNSTANSFQVFNYQMLDANGHIPNERIYYPQPLYKGYTIIGSDVTVNDNNIASGFKSYGNQQPDNSYLLLNNKIPSFTIMEIYMEFTCGNFNLDKGYPLFVNNTSIRDWYIQGNTSDNTAYYMRRWNGTANVDGVTMLSSGQTYKTKYVFNKSNNNTETAYIMVNGSWVQQFEVTSATDWWTNNYFGIGGSYSYEQGFDGSINLNETAIYLDGNCFFNGAKNWIPSTQGITGVQGYDATKTQVLKNVNGTLTWVDEA